MIMKAVLKYFRIAAIPLALLVAFGLNRLLVKWDKAEEAKAADEARYAKMVAEDDPLLAFFKEERPDHEVLLACSEDVTDDGHDDLVVICRHDGLTRSCAVLWGEGGCVITEEIPAPIENQRIRFFNMDHEGEMEFLITGEKRGEVGYAIYRIIDGEMVDLFGDGMEACC